MWLEFFFFWEIEKKNGSIKHNNKKPFKFLKLDQMINALSYLLHIKYIINDKCIQYHLKIVKSLVFLINDVNDNK